MAKHNNIIQYHNIRTKDLGIVIFVVIFLYVVICLFISSKNQTITGYQVKTGTLSENRQYSAIALRNEQEVVSDYTGHVNYFIREGERSAYANLVYCIDETGKISDLIGKSPIEDNSLSKSELKSLKQDIMLFSKNFDEKSFSDAKVFSNRIVNNLTQIENRMIIEDVTKISSDHSNDIINFCRAKASGITLFYKDGFETLKPSDITLEHFDKEKYVRTDMLNDDLVEAGSFVYKYVNDENWSLVIKATPEEAKRVADKDYVEVKFLKTLTTSWGKVTVLSETDEYSLIELSFTNSMVSFCKDRFVDIELLVEEDNGLKIPNSSIAEKPFFLIDKEYVTKGGNSSGLSVLRKEQGDNGETVKNVEISVYKEDDDVYYVDTGSLSQGNILIKPDAPVTGDDSNVFVVGKQGTLTGVYNINKGYADFNRIVILYSNDEYTIIEPNVSYGLRAFDYIALDASVVSEKDFVY